MTDQQAAQALRERIVGVLIKDARVVRGHTPADCAAAIGCAPDDFARYEAGLASPSLPELELLAYFLEVPLSYFWSDRVLSEQRNGARPTLPTAEITALRNRIIGVQLRQARQAARLPAEQLAADLDVAPAALAAYEAGLAAMPVATLQAAAARLGLPMEHFAEDQGPVGDWDRTRRALERVRQLPPELREFVSQPMNESFLRLAWRLSELPVDKLRSIAASLLEITY
jgi:transcriptional regulator with XRE-family HTH domain